MIEDYKCLGGGEEISHVTLGKSLTVKESRYRDLGKNVAQGDHY